MDPIHLPICTACGSQYDSPNGEAPPRCKICDDPRQFVPASGQSWTTLAQLSSEHKNIWAQDAKDPRICWFWTEPKFAIGQRAFILSTPEGYVMWDMIANIDAATIAHISRNFMPLRAVVVSHPHYYTTYAHWSDELQVPVYIASDDEEWLCRQPPPSGAEVRFIEGPAGTKTEILPGVTAIKTGGHFPGSLVLHWERYLFIADTIVTVPSAHTPAPRPPGQTTYVFQYSIPNCIPLDPDTIHTMWRSLRDVEFDTTFGAFNGMEVRDRRLKSRMLESMKIQVRGEGWGGHALLLEEG